MIEADIKEEVSSTSLNLMVKVLLLFIIIGIVIFVFYAIKLGIFQDKKLLIEYIKQFGILAPVCFILLQIFQVIIPVIPGGVSCLAGVLAFGPILGFVYNYIGLVIGSCIAYFLARKYGLKLIEKLFKKETINRYLKYIKKNYFSKIFWLSIFLPGLPDDLLCYVAGISKMKFDKFLVILLVGKPFSLLSYSLFMNFF